MQCPTCGNDTPGTLGTCSHCEAPIDVYSVGPVGPLAAPVADAPATSPMTGATGPLGAIAADMLGDRTVEDRTSSPAAPSWSSSGASASSTASSSTGAHPSVGTPPSAPPEFGSPTRTAPESAFTPGGPSSTGTGAAPVLGSLSERPVLRLSVEPPDPPAASSTQPTGPAEPVGGPLGSPANGSPANGFPADGSSTSGPARGSGTTQTSPSAQPSAQPSGGAPADPEDTAAWTFNPDEDDDEPEVPVPSAGPAPAAPGPAPSAFGVPPQPPDPPESIVPESWFAQPRKPDPQDVDATQAWGAQQPAALPPAALPPAAPADSAATQIAPAAGMAGGPPAPMTFGGDLEQTRMDPGSPMGGAPTGQGMPMGPMGAPMGPPGPGGPGGPAFGHPQQAGKPGGGTSKPLLAAVAALVTIAVGSVVFVVWPSGGGSSADANPGPSVSPSNTQVAQKNPIPTATKQQAAVVNKILDDSAATRRVLAGAIGRAGKCKTLPQAIRGFEQVAQRRQNQLARTRAMQVDKLANGERLRTSLAEALTASLQVDQVLLQWARKNQRNCRGRPRPAAANVPGRAAIERRATTAKQKFVVLWNPVARKTGQPPRSWKLV